MNILDEYILSLTIDEYLIIIRVSAPMFNFIDNVTELPLVKLNNEILKISHYTNFGKTLHFYNEYNYEFGTDEVFEDFVLKKLLQYAKINR